MLLPFFLGLFSAIFCSVFFPNFHILPFTPFLALACMRKSFLTTLWLSVLSGIVMDLITSELGFGLNALALTVVSGIMYRQKHHFFADSPLALSIYTTLISSLTSFFLLLLQGVTLSPSILFSELIFMPILDGVYAFLWFTCPMKLYHYGKKVGWRQILKRG
jgi:cell shape-determining protein MreD